MSAAGLFALALGAAAAIAACGSVKNDVVPSNEPFSYAPYEHLLSKYVDQEGLVDYAGMRQDTALGRFVSMLSTAVPSEMPSKRDQLAFWINTYNALTIKLIADNYPVSSITDIAGGLTGSVVPGAKSPWELTVVSIEGQRLTLKEIEDDYVKKLGDERVCFALHRASLDSPQLARHAFTADNLDQLLNEGRRNFLSNHKANFIKDGRLYLSKIFEWYAGEISARAGSLSDYLAACWPDSTEAALIAQLPSDKVEFLDYNWKLDSHRAPSR
ncbi:MAG: DUF547 domain-containing protein [Bacteroidetes bacterium]|nr:DUF547 domain-containing protein [Bacteroidota bacterium]